ncbi:hypothetical protein WEI85_43535 [Actinomycetes bacterium KLBMP 9797]
MRTEFSVHVDPAELEAQRLAAAVEPANDTANGAGKGDRRSVKGAPRESGRAKYAGRPQPAHQPKQYAFRRS